MEIRTYPALDDNYMYLVVDTETKQCGVVDPVEPKKVLDAVKENGWHLACIMTTHHHWDHASGNNELVADRGLDGLKVFGGDNRICGLTDKVNQDSSFMIGSLSVKCLSTPCHTSGHICYLVSDNGESKAIFTGDTLFVGGCGRFFEGTPDQMYDALVNKLGNLPDNTRVYCGHEYTVKNLHFAAMVEPDNQDIKDKLNWAMGQREQNKSTIPSTVGEEKRFNPFMRVREPLVKKFAQKSDPFEVMAVLRQRKNKL